MIVKSLEEALAIVRKKFASATIEGSTYDYSFLSNGYVIAEMKTNRRSKKHEWKLKFLDPKKDL